VRRAPPASPRARLPSRAHAASVRAAPIYCASTPCCAASPATLATPEPAAASAGTLTGRRARAPPSLLPRRLEAAAQDRRPVRNRLVWFVGALVLRAAGFVFAGAPPWFCSLSAASGRPRQSWKAPWCSPSTRRCLGAEPAANGAPCAVLGLRRRPPSLHRRAGAAAGRACSRPEPPDRKSTPQIAPRRRSSRHVPVNRA
jgi:hypothetical protein